MSRNEHIKIVSENRKARHNYVIGDKFEAGLALLGTEVKSIRMGRANLKDSHVKIRNGEAFVHQMHIGPCPFAFYDNHDPFRTRKLLLNRSEIRRLGIKIKERGFSLIPLTLYFKNGKAKLSIALARGKRKYDKRESIKRRDAKREMDRQRKEDGR
ncbi:SsrA-binding protein [Candidatus Desulfarcum epimagneticum]|uniref:SsrA-binding protein n=1 Tax=uncultured Desulfobacteraceae bacterium TaxID=218296 RepID=A0A484HHD7_9BACT|nr:SsrA-binding protein [uncultured Desulfobacteraceae bacterium]